MTVAKSSVNSRFSRLLAFALFLCTIPFPTSVNGDTQEVMALKAYADFKMGLYESAFTQFERLASMNNTQGLLNLAIMLDEGLGCARDPQRATKLLEQAASLGHVNAIEKLARRYQVGKVVTQDKLRAIDLFQKAASVGSGESMYQLFVIYSEHEPAKADYWLEKAKEQKYPMALLADQLEYASTMPPEVEIRIREALESIDRSANNRFVEGVIYYIESDAVISISVKGGTQQSFTKQQLGLLWQESFKKDAVYKFHRSKLTMIPLSRNQIQIESELLESFGDNPQESLTMKERLVISLDDQTIRIQSVALSTQ